MKDSLAKLMKNDVFYRCPSDDRSVRFQWIGGGEQLEKDLKKREDYLVLQHKKGCKKLYLHYEKDGIYSYPEK